MTSHSHPGVFLRTVMHQQGVTQLRLAKLMGIPNQAISEIWNAKKSITPRIALLLERELGIEAVTWLTMQMYYNLDRARAEMASSGQHT